MRSPVALCGSEAEECCQRGMSASTRLSSAANRGPMASGLYRSTMRCRAAAPCRHGTHVRGRILTCIHFAPCHSRAVRDCCRQPGSLAYPPSMQLLAPNTPLEPTLEAASCLCVTTRRMSCLR